MGLKGRKEGSAIHKSHAEMEEARVSRAKRGAAEAPGDLDRNVRKKSKTTKGVEVKGAQVDSKAFQGVAEELQQGLAAMHLATMTDLQAQCVPKIMAGEDVFAVANSGSGRRIAYLLPSAHRLHQLAFDSGTGVIVLCPTRESALQTRTVAKELLRGSPFSTGVVMDGTNENSEEARLQKHISVLVATPRRLLRHLQTTRGFLFQKLVCLVVESLDVQLKQGNELVLREILKVLPSQRQTVVLTTEVNSQVEALCEVALKSPARVEESAAQVKPQLGDWQQGYTVLEADKKFLLLYTFLRKNQDKKVAVFFATCAEVKYFVEMLPALGIPAIGIHGMQKTAKRESALAEFVAAVEGTLLCTDLIAKGVEIKGVDWVLHFDPPESIDGYLQQIGTTPRGEIQAKTLIFLHPNELRFLDRVKSAQARAFEYQFSLNKLAGIQSHYENTLDRNYHLHVAARAAHRAFVLAYAAHPDKDVFDVQQLDLMKVGKAFGFPVAPRVNYSDKKATLEGKRERSPKVAESTEDN